MKTIKPQLKLNLLRYLSSEKPDRGLVVVELIIAVIIIGILAAISLPNFTIGRWRAVESEAIGTISAVNKTQILYRQQNPTFALKFDQLALGNLVDDKGNDGQNTQSSKYYSYSIPDSNANVALIKAKGKNISFLTYAGSVVRYQNSENTFLTKQAICRADDFGKDVNPANIKPSQNNREKTCPDRTELIYQ